jgi:glycosyltransferase involved in cell wall biosynthesis
MKLLIVTTWRKIVGGVETYLAQLIPGLQSAGYEIGLITEQPSEPESADILRLAPTVPAWVARDATELLRCATAFAPDVVFSQGSAHPEWEQALAEHFYVVLFVHVYFGTCISGTKCHLIRPAPCTLRFSSLCLALYLPFGCGGRNPLTAWHLFHQQRARQRVVGQLSQIVVASQHMAQEMIRHGVSAERVRVVPLFPTDCTPDADAPALRPFTQRVLFVGRITALKGWRELVNALPVAMRQLKRTLTLVIAGTGPEERAFVQAAERAGIPTEFLGWVDSAERTAQMRQADLLVVPSVWPEPFGLVGLEAACVGTPAGAFAVGGIPEWLLAGQTGELAPGARPQAHELAAAIVRALADADHWQRLRVAAWKQAHRFSLAHHLEQLLPILDAGRARGALALRRKVI